MVLNVLFVCSKNRWRSPTAEKIYRNRPELSVRSCGTTRAAIRTLGSADLKWADVVFFMESKHKSRVFSSFPGETKFIDAYVLDIPDEYQYMDPELIDSLQLSIGPILAEIS